MCKRSGEQEKREKRNPGRLSVVRVFAVRRLQGSEQVIGLKAVAAEVEGIHVFDLEDVEDRLFQIFIVDWHVALRLLGVIARQAQD